MKNEEVFEYVITLDFSSEDNFKKTLSETRDLPNIDGLLCSYENYIVFKSLAADILSLPALSVEAARACTDKYDMRTRFMQYNPGITPEFIFIDSRDRLLEFAHTAGYPLILKPTNLVKSLLVSKCNNEEELLDAYTKTLAQIDEVYRKLHITNRNPGIILEQFITGRMCSVAGFVDKNGVLHFSDGIAKLTTAQEIGFDDNFLYARKLRNNFDPELKTKIFQVAQDGVMALSMRSSPAHIEIIYNETEVKLVEIGARIGGYRPFLYKASYGIDLLEQELNTAIDAPIDMSGHFRSYSALYELFPRQTSTFVNLANVGPEGAYDYFHQVARPGDNVGRAKDGYKSPAIIGITNSDLEVFEQRCRDIERIEVVTA